LVDSGGGLEHQSAMLVVSVLHVFSEQDARVVDVGVVLVVIINIDRDRAGSLLES